MSAELLAELDAVTKRFSGGDAPAVDAVSARVVGGQVTGLVGPDGAGKTTCALIKTPKLLLLDEPGVGVDPISRRELWRLVYDLVDRGLETLLRNGGQAVELPTVPLAEIFPLGYCVARNAWICSLWTGRAAGSTAVVSRTPSESLIPYTREFHNEEAGTVYRGGRARLGGRSPGRDG